MRRTKRLLSTTDTTEIPAKVEEDSITGTVLPTNTWTPSFVNPILSMEGSNNNNNNNNNNNSEDMAPPVKRFKLPNEVLARLGKITTSTEENNTGNEMSKENENVKEVSEVASVIRSRKLAAAERRAVRESEEVDNSLKPVVSVRRLPRHQMEQKSHRGSPPRTSAFFANDGDGIINFGTGLSAAVNSPSSSSSSSSILSDGASCRDGAEEEKNNGDARALKRRREIDRHFAGYESDELDSASASLMEEEEEEEEEEYEEEEYEEGEEEISEEEGEEEDEGDDNGNNNDDKGNGVGKVGFGLFERRRQEQKEGRQQQQQQQQQQETKNNNNNTPENVETGTSSISANSIARDRRYRYGSMFFEMHIGRDSVNHSCHHTLLCLSGPITIQGPCCIIGFGIGEISVGGFFLGKKHVLLLSEAQRVVLTPVRRLKNKCTDVKSVPIRRYFEQGDEQPITVMPPLRQDYNRNRANSNTNNDISRNGNKHNNTITDTNNNSVDDDLDDDDLDEVEMFGSVDWDWVEVTVASWRGRLASQMLNIVLIVQPYDPCGLPPTRRRYFKGKGQSKRQRNIQMSGDAFMDVPRFLARHHETEIDTALLPNVIPAILKQGPGSVVVLGSQGIGKSTLARFLANGLLSQYGVCYWLDLDLGQPEFSPPGVLSLYGVRKPLLRPHDSESVDLIKSFYLGGSRLRCPVATAIALEQLCAIVELVQRRYPVVVNTHGWVLSTGRRMTVEVIRRLQPKHIIHLVKEREVRWARESESLMDPVRGLNSEVLHKRFLVRRWVSSSTGEILESVKGKLPHPRSISAGKQNFSVNETTNWCGTVHTIQVNRDEELRQHEMSPKASVIRRGLWQQYLAPIFNYYELQQNNNNIKNNKGNRKMQEKDKNSNMHLLDAGESTTLFKGSLKQFDAIVFTDISDARDITDEVMCAALEHSVVAVSFSIEPSATPETKRTQPQKQKEDSHSTHNKPQVKQTTGNCYCLMDIPTGFPISCFGFVESSETAMRTSGEIAIRLPLPRDIVRDMLTGNTAFTCSVNGTNNSTNTSSSSSNSHVKNSVHDGITSERRKVRVSLACTLADRMDTAALEAYF